MGAEAVNACDFFADPVTCGAINDNVSGFTNAQMFSILTTDVDSPQEFTDNLIQANTTANTTAQINNLFNSY